MNANYDKSQINSILYHLAQIGTILSDAKPGTVTGTISADNNKVLSIKKILKTMGYQDDSEIEDVKESYPEEEDEKYMEEQLELLCGQWKPWKKKSLPEIHISRLTKEVFLIKMVDPVLAIEYCSVKIDHDALGNIFFILAGEEITIQYFEPDIDDIDSIQLKETLYLRK